MPLIQMPDQHTMIKAAVAGSAYLAGEYYVLNNRDTMGVAYNGLATAGGILVISTVDETILSVDTKKVQVQLVRKDSLLVRTCFLRA